MGWVVMGGGRNREGLRPQQRVEVVVGACVPGGGGLGVVGAGSPRWWKDRSLGLTSTGGEGGSFGRTTPGGGGVVTAFEGVRRGERPWWSGRWLGWVPSDCGRSCRRALPVVRGPPGLAPLPEEEVVGEVGSCGGRRWEIVGAVGAGAPR